MATEGGAVDVASILARAMAASVPDAEQHGGGSLGYDVDGIPPGIRYAFEREEDYTFVLHAREDVLALLAALAAAEGERDELRRQARAAADWEMRQYDLRTLAEAARLYVRDPCPSNLADLAGLVAAMEVAALTGPPEAQAGEAT